MSNVQKKISEAEDSLELCDLLSAVTESDIQKLKPLIPDLIENKYWIVRCDILEIIGSFELSEFLDLVQKRLRDRTILVRLYALTAYYDLLKGKALRVIRQFTQDKHVNLRLAALILCYVETRDEEVLRQIRRIVTRKDCDYHHQYVFLHSCEDYLDTSKCPEIIQIYRDILRSIPKSRGVAKDIGKRLKEIRALKMGR